MHKIELRTGRWFLFKNHHDERIIMPADTDETVEQFCKRYQVAAATEQEGTGVRVTDDHDNVIEEWVVRRNVDGAFETARALLEKYEDR